MATSPWTTLRSTALPVHCPLPQCWVQGLGLCRVWGLGFKAWRLWSRGSRTYVSTCLGHSGCGWV